jgi:hypothetical protein
MVRSYLNVFYFSDAILVISEAQFFLNEGLLLILFMIFLFKHLSFYFSTLANSTIGYL